MDTQLSEVNKFQCLSLDTQQQVHHNTIPHFPQIYQHFLHKKPLKNILREKTKTCRTPLKYSPLCYLTLNHITIQIKPSLDKHYNPINKFADYFPLFNLHSVQIQNKSVHFPPINKHYVYNLSLFPSDDHHNHSHHNLTSNFSTNHVI